MDAWPIEEVWLRPAVTPALCAAVPFATAWVLRAVLSRDRRQVDRAGAIVAFAQLELGWWLGVTALGPRLVDGPGGVVSHAFGVGCASVAAAATARAFGWSFDRRALGIAAAAMVGAATSAVLEAPRGAIGAVVLGVAWIGVSWIERGRRGRTSSDAPVEAPAAGSGFAIAAGVAVSASIAAAAALGWTLTEIAEGDAPDATAAAATWRLRVDPWDPVGMLAAGWASRRREELDRAVAQAREARRMGLPEAPALELEAEVLAARGRCSEARAAFDRALGARAARVFDADPLAAPLALGGYHLPPTLVSACDGLDALPRLDVSED